MNPNARVTKEFQRRFGELPRFLVRAPGRVNLIGEHTDYNDGFVLPMAINRATWIALRSRSDQRIVLHALDHGDDPKLEFSLSDLNRRGKHWGEYPKGVAWALREAGHSLRGWEGVTACDVPMGAGLSSSASFELAVARAFQAVSGFAWDAPAIARVCQRAENQWVGMNCGIMDQMISACGKDGHALLIDCRSLETRPVPLPKDTVIVVLDTTTRRGLVDSAYNERRAQCEAAAKLFGVKALRDISVEQFAVRAESVDAVTRRRARHVITENARTLQAAATSDPVALGKLMNASHESLRDDFEVTNNELNAIVQCARNTEGCYGTRMTGAGFGGCAVALVRTDKTEEFAEAIRTAYYSETSLTPRIYVCLATDGAERV
jgi:galactokinase